MSNKEFEGDAGAPLPDFSTGGIRLDTIAPALGVTSQRQPDYLDYDQKGRGMVVTMFANCGVSYMLGIAGGGLYGFQKGVTSTPSSKLKVQVNSVLNHCGRYGSKAGNTLGVFAVMYSLYEGIFDQVSIVYLWYKMKKVRWGFHWEKRINFFRIFLSFQILSNTVLLYYYNRQPISLTWNNILESKRFLRL
jgi:hypothetical protein